MLGQCISLVPRFVSESWQHLRLDNLWLPLRNSSMTWYFIPIPLSALVWTIAAAYWKFSTGDSIATSQPERDLRFSSVVEGIQQFGESLTRSASSRPSSDRNDTAVSLSAKLLTSPVEGFGYAVLKRVFDLVASLLGVIVLGPVMLLIAALVKSKLSRPSVFLSGPGRAPRKSFYHGEVPHHVLEQPARGDTVWTPDGDSRVTPLGLVLRTLSLNVLLQLFNVIRGDMSLVGATSRTSLLRHQVPRGFSGLQHAPLLSRRYHGMGPGEWPAG